jgi:hypothetical protein
MTGWISGNLSFAGQLVLGLITGAWLGYFQATGLCLVVEKRNILDWAEHLKYIFIIKFNSGEQCYYHYIKIVGYKMYLHLLFNICIGNQQETMSWFIYVYNHNWHSRTNNCVIIIKYQPTSSMNDLWTIFCTSWSKNVLIHLNKM